MIDDIKRELIEIQKLINETKPNEYMRKSSLLLRKIPLLKLLEEQEKFTKENYKKIIKQLEDDIRNYGRK